jgi:hypothetical protein
MKACLWMENIIAVQRIVVANPVTRSSHAIEKDTPVDGY